MGKAAVARKGRLAQQQPKRGSPFGLGQRTCEREAVYTPQSQDPLSTLAATPVRTEALDYWLADYNNKQDAHFLRLGFTEGFRIPYNGPRVARGAENHGSAHKHPLVVMEKLEEEVRLGRVAGPYKHRPIDNLIVSPVGLVEKSTPGEYRLIFDLSHPHGGSVNSGIPTEYSAVEYTPFDAVTEMMRRLGQGAHLFKIDITSAFRLLPLHPEDFGLMGMHVNGRFYVDKTLPFGCSVSCALFQ